MTHADLKRLLQEVGEQSALPKGFRIRYVAAKVMIVAPALLSMTMVFLIVSKENTLMLSLSPIVMLVFCALASRRQAMRAEVIFRLAGQEAASEILSERWQLHVGAISCAALLCGAGYSWFKHDIRWAIVAGGVGALLACGFGLGWFIFDRWLSHLPADSLSAEGELEPEHRDTST